MQLIEDPEMKGFYNNDDDDAGTTAPFWRANFHPGIIDCYFDRVVVQQVHIGRRHMDQLDIPLSQITSVDFRPAGLASTGALRIVSPGYGPTDARNAVFFSRGGNNLAEGVRSLVLDAKATEQRLHLEMMAPPTPFSMPAPQAAASAPAPSRPTAQDLVRLKALLDRGALTPEEFDQAKRAILSRMTTARADDI